VHELLLDLYVGYRTFVVLTLRILVSGLILLSLCPDRSLGLSYHGEKLPSAEDKNA
jgi:hypothetical protein